jgi:cyanophycinase
MNEYGVRYGMGIDEDTAVVVRGGQAEIVGYRGALLIDMSQAKRNSQLAGFNLSDVRLTYLDRGDRLDLATLRLTPSADKRAEERIDPNSASFRPSYNERIYSNDILSNSALLEIMKRLMNNSQAEGLGLAYDGNEAQSKAAQGFEFRVSRTANTVAWLTGASGSQDWTIAGMRLDVRPVTIRGPLYAAQP